MKARVIAFINASLGSAPTASYLSMAQAAYRKGDWDTALRMYYAELLTADDDQLGDLLNHYYLYRPRVAKPEDLTGIGEHGQTIKPRLTTALRFAVGVILDLGPQVTDVKPVGVRQAGGAARGYQSRFIRFGRRCRGTVAVGELSGLNRRIGQYAVGGC